MYILSKPHTFNFLLHSIKKFLKNSCMLINVSIMILLKWDALLIQGVMPKKDCLLIQYGRARKIIIEVIVSQDADFNFCIDSLNFLSV